MLVGSLLLALLLASFVLYAHVLIHKPSVQKALVERLSLATGYRIQTGRIELSLWGGVGVLAHTFEASSQAGTERIEAASLHLLLDPGDLLRGRVTPVRLTLVGPRLELEALEADASPAEALAGPAFPWLPGLESLSVERGTLKIRDRPYGAEAVRMEVRAGTGAPASLAVSASGRIRFREDSVPFRTRGTVTPASKGTAAAVDFEATVEDVPMVRLPWPDKLAFEGGTVAGRWTLKGDLNRPLKVRGRAAATGVRFLLRDEGRVKPYRPPEIVVGFQGEVSGSHLRLPDMTLRAGALSLVLGLNVELPDRDEPRIHLRTESEPMPFDLMARYFPTPLLAAWVETRLFPLLRSGTVRLGHLTIAGTLEEIESLDQPEHAHALSLAVDCHGFRVAGPAVPTPFEAVSARVAYDSGRLTIADLEGTLADSTIREGRLEIRELLGDRPVWDILVDGDFRLRTLQEQKRIDVIPPDVLHLLERLGPLSGLLSCRARFRYESGWNVPRTREGSFTIREAVIRQPELRLPLALSSATILVSEEGNRFEASGAWGRSAFEAEGRFGSGATPFPLQTAEVFARVDMNEALPVLLRGFELPMAFEGPVATRFSLTRERGRWHARGRVDLQEVTLRNDQVSMHPPGPEDHVTFDLFLGPGEHLSLEHVHCRFHGSELSLSGGYDLERRDLFTLEVSTSSLDLEDLGLRFHDHGRPSSGRLQGNLKLLASRKDPLATVILGEVEGEGITAELHRIPSPIRDASFSLAFSGKDVSIQRCRMRVGETEMEVDGELEGWRRIAGQLRVHAEFLNPDDLLPREPRTASGSGLVPDRVNVRLEVHGRTAFFKGMRLGPLRAEVHLRDGEVRLARSRIRLPHGVLTSHGRIRGEPAPGIALVNHIRLTAQPLPELLDELGIEEGPFLEGTLNMAAYLNLEGRTMEDLLPSLSGNVEVVIQRGVLRKSGVFSRVLEMMSLENLIKGKPSGLPEGGFYFERMKGFGVIDRGVLATENFTMSSPVYNAVAAGEADLNEKTVDFTLGVRPLETLDAIVSRIPILGYALTGRDRSFLTYYFAVSGPMKDPDTRHVPFRHLGGGVAGVLKRLFLSPLRLYDNLSGATRSATP